MFFPETSDLLVYAKAKKYAIINTHQCVNKSPLAISATALVSMHVHVLLYHEKPLAPSPSMEVWYNRVSRETILLNTARFSQSTRENRWQFSFSRLWSSNPRLTWSSVQVRSWTHTHTHWHTDQASPTTSMAFPQSELIAIWRFPKMGVPQ